MSKEISQNLLPELSAYLARQTGLRFPRERWGELEKGIAAAAREFGYHDVEQCVRWLMSAPLDRRQVETLAAHLTVGETYFYRDPRMLEIIATKILLPLVQARRGKEQRLRIWSAGCSSGEEPYTLAVMLQRMLPDLEEWQVSILATDINHAALQKGREGVYGKWSFRGTPSWFKAFYFTPEPQERFRVAEPVRRMVCFEYLNLAEDSYPSLPTNTNAMDLILCRNVLMYFATETVQTVVGKLHRCLTDEGWLVVSAAETSPHGYPGYLSVALEGATCYRKRIPGRQENDHGWQTAQEARPGSVPAAPSAPPAVSAPAVESVPPAQEQPAETLPWARERYRRGDYLEVVELLAPLRGEAWLPAEALSLLVRSQANLGRLAEALEVCDDALTRHKLDPALHYLRAEILQEMGMTVEAQASLQRSLYLDPDSALARFALGNLLQWSGKEERAGKEFQNALALLEKLPPDRVIPGSEGMTAGRLAEVIRSMNEGAGRVDRGRR